MGNLTVYFSPVGKAPSSFGANGFRALHITLTYSDGNGNYSYISMGPTKANDLSPAGIIGETLLANVDMYTNTPSYWGTLTVNGEGSYTPGNMHDGVDVVPEGEPGAGSPLKGEYISLNASLADFNRVKATVHAIADLHLTYNPVLQNSNAGMCTALVLNGFNRPVSPPSTIAPACNNLLPTNNSELNQYLQKMKSNAVSGYNISQSQDPSTGMWSTVVDSFNPFDLDFLIRSGQKTGHVYASEVRNQDTHEVDVVNSAIVGADQATIELLQNDLDIDLHGNDNNIYGNGYINQDLEVYGNSNVAFVDNSSVDFYGSDNGAYGYGTSGAGWSYGGDTEFGSSAAAATSNGQVVDPSKLIELMSGFGTGNSAPRNPNGTTVELPWATIAAHS